MKLGVITDIHNNFAALKVIIERLKQLECDKLRFNYSEFAIIRRVTNLNCYKKYRTENF